MVREKESIEENEGLIDIETVENRCENDGYQVYLMISKH